MPLHLPWVQVQVTSIPDDSILFQKKVDIRVPIHPIHTSSKRTLATCLIHLCVQRPDRCCAGGWPLAKPWALLKVVTQELFQVTTPHLQTQTVRPPGAASAFHRDCQTAMAKGWPRTNCCQCPSCRLDWPAASVIPCCQWNLKAFRVLFWIRKSSGQRDPSSV